MASDESVWSNRPQPAHLLERKDPLLLVSGEIQTHNRPQHTLQLQLK